MRFALGGVVLAAILAAVRGDPLCLNLAELNPDDAEPTDADAAIACATTEEDILAQLGCSSNIGNLTTGDISPTTEPVPLVDLIVLQRCTTVSNCTTEDWRLGSTMFASHVPPEFWARYTWGLSTIPTRTWTATIGASCPLTENSTVTDPRQTGLIARALARLPTSVAATYDDDEIPFSTLTPSPCKVIKYVTDNGCCRKPHFAGVYPPFLLSCFDGDGKSTFEDAADSEFDSLVNLRHLEPFKSISLFANKLLPALLGFGAVFLTIYLSWRVARSEPIDADDHVRRHKLERLPFWVTWAVPKSVHTEGKYDLSYFDAENRTGMNLATAFGRIALPTVVGWVVFILVGYAFPAISWSPSGIDEYPSMDTTRYLQAPPQCQDIGLLANDDCSTIIDEWLIFFAPAVGILFVFLAYAVVAIRRWPVFHPDIMARVFSLSTMIFMIFYAFIWFAMAPFVTPAFAIRRISSVIITFAAPAFLFFDLKSWVDDIKTNVAELVLLKAKRVHDGTDDDGANDPPAELVLGIDDDSEEEEEADDGGIGKEVGLLTEAFRSAVELVEPGDSRTFSKNDVEHLIEVLNEIKVFKLISIRQIIVITAVFAAYIALLMLAISSLMDVLTNRSLTISLIQTTVGSLAAVLSERLTKFRVAPSDRTKSRDVVFNAVSKSAIVTLALHQVASDSKAAADKDDSATPEADESTSESTSTSTSSESPSLYASSESS